MPRYGRLIPIGCALAALLPVNAVMAAGNNAHKAPTLRFRENGFFRIVQFTDVHWEAGDATDQQTAALMGAILDEEKPDLVVLTGDIIGGQDCTQPRAAIPLAFAPMVDRQIPWAFTFGNHDDECGLSRAEIMAILEELPYSVCKPGPSDILGVSNYMLPIRASKGRKQAATVYCIDSNDYVALRPKEYDWIHPDQIHWYLETARHIRERNKGARLPALAFFHIPLPEYTDVWNAGGCVGSKNEEVASPTINSGFFAALLEARDVMATCVGHDHTSDYEGDLRGIRLCYGRASGFTGYGREGFLRGARVLELKEGERSFTTWLRLEGNQKVVLSESASVKAAG